MAPGSSHKRTLLMVDDDRLLCDTVQEALKPLRLQVRTAHTGADGMRLCAENPADIVLLDQKLPDGDGIDFCAPYLDHNENTKIVFITAYPSFENAVQAIKVGAHDYLSKPFEIAELLLAVNQALRTLELEQFEQVHHYQHKREQAQTVLIGSRGGLEEVQRLVALAGTNGSPVLITGETGTGKTRVAKAIHYAGVDSDKPFIAINCAAIPENLIEAELFGHTKGAFTGAVTTGKGLFEMADGGTLFLDEIGEMPTHLQSKLLGALDDGQIRAVGAETFKTVNARIIAATNADLSDAVRTRRFREDLYYRLSVVHIHIPPLRQRIGDIPDLCRYLVSQIDAEHDLQLGNEQICMLQQYDWPGNVRELRNILERAVLVRRSRHLEPARLLDPTLGAGGPPNPMNDQKAAGCEAILTLSEIEKTHIRKSLDRFNGNHTHAAKALGISRSTLLRKLKSYQLT